MQAMFYENLMRMVYLGGHNYKTGADASIYRSMEHAHTDLTTKSMYGTQEAREDKYRSRFAGVRSYVGNALTEGVKQIKYSATEEDIAALQAMQARLNLDFYDKQTLDEIIRQAIDLFSKYSLLAR